MTKGVANQPLRVCDIDGCEGKHLARGYCELHYYRLIRGRSLNIERPGDYGYLKDQPLNQSEFCKVMDCKEQGFRDKDIAFEVQRNIGIVRKAMLFDSFREYCLGKRFDESYI